jgi:hypothetical protein
LKGAALANATSAACSLAAVKELSRQKSNSTRKESIMRWQRLKFDCGVVSPFVDWLE